MHLSEPYLSRRALLSSVTGGTLLLTLGACISGGQEPSPTGPDPIEPVLAASVYLADRYTAAMAAVPDLADRLTPLRDAHQAHITALTRELGTVDDGILPSGRPPAVAPAGSESTPAATASSGNAAAPEVTASPVPLPAERPAILADLQGLERSGRQQAAALCLAGSRYRAALLGSIAAARASHAEVLT
ncbi:MAG: hypothetical protein HKP61_03190 [Dactylosporangium sp.]|nr:hypothetical protein [Dactylosporangium sp.]NNJ59960.1 hypothetical protein [Dactylosporangium sp.]